MLTSNSSKKQKYVVAKHFSWLTKDFTPLTSKIQNKSAKYSLVIPFAKNLDLKDINPEWAEKRSGFRKLAEVPIRFVPVISSYDAEPDNSNSFSLSVNLSSTPEIKITKSVNKSGEEVTEKEYKKEGQVKQVIKKLCSGSAEAYLKWKIQVYHVLKNRPCESPKDKLDVAEAMLYGDLLESWKLWRKTESEKEMEGTF